MAKVNLDSTFYCCKCGAKGIPITRIKGKEREAGHLKKLWCLKCKQETNHAECKAYTKYTEEDFLLEFNYGNFDEQQNRIERYGFFKDRLLRKGVIYYK